MVLKAATDPERMVSIRRRLAKTGLRWRILCFLVSFREPFVKHDGRWNCWQLRWNHAGMLREGLAQLPFLESKKSALRGLIPHWRSAPWVRSLSGTPWTFSRWRSKLWTFSRWRSKLCRGSQNFIPPPMASKDAGGVGGEAPSGAVSRPYFSWSAELMDVN